MKTIQTLCIILLSTIGLQAQNKASIFEVGKPIVSCEANFENLLNNWNTLNITNADVYKVQGFKLVEEISDSTKYNYYKNYFSGEKPVYASVHSSYRESNGIKTSKFYIKPGYLHEAIYDPRKMPLKSKMIFTKEMLNKAQNILEAEFDIETSDIWVCEYKIKEKSDTTYFISQPHRIKSFNTSSKDIKVISVKPISQNYIDINVTHEKSHKDLNVTESQDIFMEELWVHKTMYQALYTDKVRIGDLVYSVDFRYYGKKYTAFVICSHETNRVVFDTFFKKIKIESN